MFVKICGITRPQDAVVAESAGADAIGMIFAPGSKRELDLAQATEIAAAVGPFVTKVGVFRDAPIESVRRALEQLRLDAVQLHGREDSAYVASLRTEVAVLKAVRFHATLTPADLHGYGADAVLLDGAVPGSGRPFDWDAATQFRDHPRLVLAGGLDAENVGRAIEAMAPYAVDVASGVESAPGLKDSDKVHRFIAAAKASSRRPFGASRGGRGT